MGRFRQESFASNSFNSAIMKAQKNDIKCAWSNEAFELWYLLHFHNRTTAMSRDEYKKAIENGVNEKNENRKKFKYLKNALDTYSVLEKAGNQTQAIKWAESLEQSFSGNQFADYNPCTQVYKLVLELIGKSSKLNEKLIAKFNSGI